MSRAPGRSCGPRRAFQDAPLGSSRAPAAPNAARPPTPGAGVPKGWPTGLQPLPRRRLPRNAARGPAHSLQGQTPGRGPASGGTSPGTEHPAGRAGVGLGLGLPERGWGSCLSCAWLGRLSGSYTEHGGACAGRSGGHIPSAFTRRAHLCPCCTHSPSVPAGAPHLSWDLPSTCLSEGLEGTKAGMKEKMAGT